MSRKRNIDAPGTAGATSTDSAGGAPVGNRNREVHSYYRRKRQVARVDFDELHKGSSGAIALLERKQELVEHAGGEQHVSAVMRRTIERTAVTEYLLDVIDLFLLEQGARIIRRRSRSLIPIVGERSRLVASLVSLYEKIGYAPTAHRVDVIAEATYLAEADKRRNTEPEVKVEGESPNE